jgi:hypothetical protein
MAHRVAALLSAFRLIAAKGRGRGDAIVTGFKCRPMDLSTRTRVGIRKPPGNETAGVEKAIGRHYGDFVST